MTDLAYAEYLQHEDRSERRHEFVDGAVRAMPDNNPEHARLAAAIGAELGRALSARRCAVFSSSLRIRIDATNRSTSASRPATTRTPWPASSSA